MIWQRDDDWQALYGEQIIMKEAEEVGEGQSISPCYSRRTVLCLAISLCYKSKMFCSKWEQSSGCDAYILQTSPTSRQVDVHPVNPAVSGQ